MATHTHLPIYKVAYDLLDVVTSLVKNMQRDFKRSIGAKAAYAQAIELTTNIGKQANGWRRAAHRPLHGGQGRHD